MVALMRSCGAILGVALSLSLAACARRAPESKSPPPPAPEASAARDEGPRRAQLTRTLVDKHKLTQSELAELQLYVRGSIVLRREADAGMREITEDHTLRVVDDRTHDDIVVEAGTPGVFVSVQQQGLLVNFDPDEPESGLVFEARRTDAYQLRIDNDPAFQGGVVHYGGATYRVVQGTGATLELDTERLDELTSQQRKLPGNLLPPGSAAPEPEAVSSGDD